MSERFLKNLSTTFGWLSIGMLFALGAFCSSVEITDLDLWLHLRMGWWICHHGFVPNYDILSGTISGKPWVNHEWLFQVLVYQLQKVYGFNGLISMQSFVVALTFLVLLFLGYSRERQLLTVYTLLLVLMVYQTRFTIRPDIFSLLFFVLFIYILSFHINKRWAVYVLVGLQIVWSNMHLFFFFGPLLVGVGILSEFIKRRLPLPFEWNTAGRLKDEEYSSLKRILLFLILASCANPLTFKGAWDPVSVFFHLAVDNKMFFENIIELQKPITAGTIFSNNLLYYKILIFISAISFVFNRRKINISSLLVWVIFLGFSLVAVRNLIYFAVVAYMALMVNVISIPWKNLVPLYFFSSKFKDLIIIFGKVGVMIWMLNFGRAMTSDGEFFGVSKRVYPYRAVDFLVHNKIKGNFFNDFNSGAYLVGRAYPNIKVFIDGRTELYGFNFFENYQKIWKEGNSQVFAYFESKDNITGAFLNNAYQGVSRNALIMFYSFKNWSIVYLDDDAVIFLKQTPYNKPFIDRFSVDLNRWKPKPLDFSELGTRRIDPFPFVRRAYILEILGADQAAITESKEALRVEPDYGPAYNMLWKIYDKRKDYKKAFEYRLLGDMYSGDRRGHRLVGNFKLKVISSLSSTGGR